MAEYISIHRGQELDTATTKVLNGTCGIQGVKSNGTEITPDSENKVDITIPVVSQTTGESTTEVMSQNALTNILGSKINDTEVGTWTPQFVLGGVGNTLPTYTTLACYSQYYRVGKVCYITCYCRFNITDPGNIQLYIGGLPFRVSSDEGWQTISGDAYDTYYSQAGGLLLYSGETFGCVRKMHSNDNEKLKVTNALKLAYSGFYIIDSVYY